MVAGRNGPPEWGPWTPGAWLLWEREAVFQRAFPGL